MVMDPLTALGLVSNIVQFLSFGAGLLSQSWAIYKSLNGTSDDVVDTEIATTDLLRVTHGLKQSILPNDTTALTAAETSLDNLRIRCHDVGEELLAILDKLTIKGQKTRWKSIKQALAREWKDGKLKELQGRLQHLRAEMNLHVVVSLR
jgi:hypothetical protein